MEDDEQYILSSESQRWRWRRYMKDLLCKNKNWFEVTNWTISIIAFMLGTILFQTHKIAWAFLIYSLLFSYVAMSSFFMVFRYAHRHLQHDVQFRLVQFVSLLTEMLVLLGFALLCFLNTEEYDLRSANKNAINNSTENGSENEISREDQEDHNTAITRCKTISSLGLFLAFSAFVLRIGDFCASGFCTIEKLRNGFSATNEPTVYYQNEQATVRSHYDVNTPSPYLRNRPLPRPDLPTESIIMRRTDDAHSGNSEVPKSVSFFGAADSWAEPWEDYIASGATWFDLTRSRSPPPLKKSPRKLVNLSPEKAYSAISEKDHFVRCYPSGRIPFTSIGVQLEPSEFYMTALKDHAEAISLLSEQAQDDSPPQAIALPELPELEQTPSEYTNDTISSSGMPPEMEQIPSDNTSDTTSTDGKLDLSVRPKKKGKREGIKITYFPSNEGSNEDIPQTIVQPVTSQQRHLHSETIPEETFEQASESSTANEDVDMA